MENDCLHVHIEYPNLDIDNSTYFLQVMERYTSKEKKYSLTASPNVLSACLSSSDLELLLLEGKDWDVYVTTEHHNIRERRRVSSLAQELELSFFLKEDKLLTPFTTNKGNLSFKSQISTLISKVEEVHFIKKDSIRIKGFILDPNPLRDSIVNAELIFIHFEKEWSHKPSINLENRISIIQKYRKGDNPYYFTGYEAIVPIEAIIPSFETSSNSLKAKLNLHYVKYGENKITKTSSVQVKTPQISKKTIVKKTRDNKILVSITKTQKAKYLSINIHEYQFRKHFKTQVKRTLLTMKRHSFTKSLYKSAFYILGKLPSNKKIIVFESFLGKQFSDNPRAIYEYLKEHEFPYKLYWSVDKKYVHHFSDKNLQCIRRFSIKWLFIMPRASFWVTNSRMPLWIPKPKSTTYLQTWHGTPLKKLAADMDEVYMPGTTAEKYKRNFIKEAKNWDYLISPNAYSTEIFRRAFQFDKEVLETGYPRNDYICKYNDQETAKKLAMELNIPVHKKVILYAPTWRDNQFFTTGKYRFDINLDLNLLKQRLEDDYVILFRLHYLISENLDLSAFDGFSYDMSNHKDIRELYVMADILITDYSSVFFDYSNLRRPMIFYVYDMEEYRDKLRGFYFDFEQEAPGPLVKTTEEVIEAVKHIEADEFQLPTKFKSFYDKFCYLENGDSARKVAERIFLQVKKGETG